MLGQLVVSVHTNAAPTNDVDCGQNDLAMAAESLKPIAVDSGGKLLVLLQCSRPNPGVNTRAYIVGSEVEQVLDAGISGAHWLNGELVLVERVIQTLLPGLKFEFVAALRPWATAVPMLEMDRIRSVSVGSDGAIVAGITVASSGASSLSVFQLNGHVATRVPVEMPQALQGNMLGFVVLDKPSRRLAFSVMMYDPSARSQVNRTFLLARSGGDVKPLQLQQSRPLFFADDKIFVIDRTGAMVGCNVETGTCSPYVSFASERKRIESAVAAGNGTAIVLVRHLPRDPFDIRATEVVLVDLASRTVRSRTELPEGQFIRSVDWTPD